MVTSNKLTMAYQLDLAAQSLARAAQLLGAENFGADIAVRRAFEHLREAENLRNAMGGDPL